MDSKINFGESLAEIIDQRNIKVETLAKAINVSSATVYDWKRSKQDIKLSNLVATANYLHCTISFLIGVSEDSVFIEAKTCPHFGKRLRKIMKEKGETTYKFRQIGYGSKHFENWDRGADPFLSTLAELSKILDCSIDYLVGRE